MSEDATTTEHPGGSVVWTDEGAFIIKPDAGAQTIAVTYYENAGEEERPVLREWGVGLHAGDALDLADALMFAAGFCFDNLPPLPCADCGRDVRELGEYYMVQEAIWHDELGLDKENLCIECLEKRLGRELTPEDFTDVPVNRDKVEASELLRSRQGHRGEGESKL